MSFIPGLVLVLMLVLLLLLFTDAVACHVSAPLAHRGHGLSGGALAGAVWELSAAGDA